MWGNQIPIKENGIKRIVNLEKLIVVFHLYMRTGFWIDQTNKVVDIYLFYDPETSPFTEWGIVTLIFG